MVRGQKAAQARFLAGAVRWANPAALAPCAGWLSEPSQLRHREKATCDLREHCLEHTSSMHNFPHSIYTTLWSISRKRNKKGEGEGEGLQNVGRGTMVDVRAPRGRRDPYGQPCAVQPESAHKNSGDPSAISPTNRNKIITKPTYNENLTPLILLIRQSKAGRGSCSHLI